MKLNFTGRGAMLYPCEGNTSSYFEDENNLFLIDCGEDVAQKLIRENLLVKNKNYYLFVTHTHSDHIGSLGTLQQYLYWICGVKLNIVIDDNVKYMQELQSVLDGFGLESGTYEFVRTSELDNKFKSFNKIRYVESNHGDVPFASASIVISTNDGDVLYTGDIADSKVIEAFIDNCDDIEAMYVDTSYTKTPVHLSIDDLNQVIPDELKSKVYCMHINDKKLIPKIREYGFNLVSLNGIDLLNRDIATMEDDELTLLEGKLNAKLELVKKIRSERVKS